jgi:hypothetical protein
LSSRSASSSEKLSLSASIQLTAGAHPCERERRLGTAGQDKLEGVKEVINKEGKTLVDLGIRDQMVVIEYEHDLAR